MAYVIVKLPLAAFGFYAAFSLWWDAFACLTHTLWNSGQNSPPVFGLVRNVFPPGYLSVGTSGPFHGIAIFVTGVIFLFAAPWAVRAMVYLDRLLMQALLAPDSMTMRVRSLEHARAQTVDASAATLRRIERDLHDGTQAQLVALAMRLGIAKEKLAAGPPIDLDEVRALVDDAHRGAKEALVELRDLARGIHPPALDTGLEGALSTLAARSPVPTEVTLALIDRPTPAIESIAYFCVAELLANVAQHADASRASVSCTAVRPMAAPGRARRRQRRRRAGEAGVLVERAGRTDRSGARRRRAPEHREPARWADRGDRRPPLARLDGRRAPCPTRSGSSSPRTQPSCVTVSSSFSSTGNSSSPMPSRTRMPCDGRWSVTAPT